MTDDLIHYPALIDNAMRTVVRDVMKRVQSSGLPGEHHFYISFLTHFPGVRMSDQLKSRYPKEITIVMQHQYWDFKVDDIAFNVTLSFGGIPEKLTVPFAAMTAFADPSVKFGLQFQPADLPAALPEPAGNDAPAISATAVLETGEDSGAAQIISLDSFRKK